MNLASLTTQEPNENLVSRSLLFGMRVWSSFSLTGEDKGVHELAGELGVKPSRAHRYMNTLEMVGSLERTAKRRYRLPVLDESDTEAGGTDAGS